MRAETFTRSIQFSPVDLGTIAIGDYSMTKFTIVGEELWARMERAVEKVNDRLRKTVRILKMRKCPMRLLEGMLFVPGLPKSTKQH